MRAWQLTNGFGLSNLNLNEILLSPLKDHEVRVKIHAASLNFRDLMVIKGQYNPKASFPLTPLSDGSGEVVEVGKNVTKVAVGDKICATFSQNWSHGPPSAETFKSTLGSPLAGMLSEFGTFLEDGLIKFPNHLDYVEASTLPCAGVTAFNALMCQSELKPGESVLLLGTGGVSLFALQFAKILGLNVIITSSSDEKLKKAGALGADYFINYKKEPEWAKQVQKLTASLGVDAVIEVGGAKTLGSSIASVKKGGVVCLIGVLSGSSEALDLRPVLMNNIRIQGIFVGSRELFIAMNRVISHSKLRPVIDSVFDFKDAPKAFLHLESGDHFGKVVIKIS